MDDRKGTNDGCACEWYDSDPEMHDRIVEWANKGALVELAEYLDLSGDREAPGSGPQWTDFTDFVARHEWADSTDATSLARFVSMFTFNLAYRVQVQQGPIWQEEAERERLNRARRHLAFVDDLLGELGADELPEFVGTLPTGR